MTEIVSPRVTPPRIVVRGVQPGDPPFRIVKMDGELVGIARSIVDVIEIARQAGLGHLDLDDPDVVRWVGGDKFTWTPWLVWSRRGRARAERAEREAG
ncbi:hypothetical protein RKE29_26500 [Streptomyces sp. B1866]|uniref:hypothetical protein n=1 Tax=Streptomyces sp. B1866 TaxID=3075431 RepID=UPI00288EE1CD|nr:hypothetical protein [Streptomyces sp. B1866]MDT3400130.1 hypothetical protein [Streptomyces sp. B1866]